MGVDFGKTAQDYSRHRAGFPEAFFERLAIPHRVFAVICQVPEKIHTL